MNFRDHSLLGEESEFNHIKRKRKRMNIVINIICIVVLVAIMLLAAYLKTII